MLVFAFISVGEIAGWIGAVAGLVGMVTGIAGVVNNRFLAVNAYMVAMENPEFIRARCYVYNIDPQNISIDDEQVATVVNFFHHWGILARKHYLPMWVFKHGSGAGVIRLYELTESYIYKMRCDKRDNTYAMEFEWLYSKLKRKI